MNEDSALNTKIMLKQLTEYCKDYRSIEKEIAIAKNELTISKNEIHTLKMGIDALVQQVGGLYPIDLDVLNQEISILSEEKSKLGIFAFKRIGEINSLLKRKQNELAEAIYKNNLIAKLEEKKKASDSAVNKQKELEDVFKTKIEAVNHIKELIRNYIDVFLSMSEDVLYSLLLELGADMEHLPNSVLNRAISKGVPEFLKDMPVQRQVRLLYPYDTTIYFGGRKWNVLEIRNNKALLLLRGSYACSNYYREKYVWQDRACKGNAFKRGEASSLTWEYSDARKILNNDFINSLHLKENEKILPGYNSDMAFCLSKREVEKYLEPNQRTINSAWWLRDVIPSKLEVAYVDVFGVIKYNPHNYEDTREARAWTHDDMRFRPAVWVELPHDSLDTEWNEKSININCKGKWTAKNSYSYSVPDVALTPDVIDRINSAASSAVNGSPSEELPDFIVVPRIDVSDM